MQHKYVWGRFITAFKKIHTYAIHVDKTSSTPMAALTLTFKDPLQAEIFLYWVMQLGLTNRYEAVVYLNDHLPEVLAELNKQPPRDAVGVE